MFNNWTIKILKKCLDLCNIHVFLLQDECGDMGIGKIRLILHNNPLPKRFLKRRAGDVETLSIHNMLLWEEWNF